MRTTIDLPDDLHAIVQAIARDTSRSMSDTAADLIRRGLGGGERRKFSDEITYSARTGFPQLSVGRTITTEDVRSLEDDE